MGVADSEYYAPLAPQRAIPRWGEQNGWISFFRFDQIVRYGTDCPNTGYQDNNGSPVLSCTLRTFTLKVPQIWGFPNLGDLGGLNKTKR
uniref:Uncharacterized protein n=1 Tax=Moorena producens (strain JHB) TaxID=1454205 RepID=A0A1D9G126_MOOP1